MDTMNSVYNAYVQSYVVNPARIALHFLLI